MKKAPVLDYAFAVGKIRSLERFLITEETFTQARDADLAQALRLFAEADLYGEELLRVKDSEDLEIVLDKELEELRSLVGGLLLDKPFEDLVQSDTLAYREYLLKNCPSSFLRDYLRQALDMHNIKTFLRLYILQEPPEKLKGFLGSGGFIPIADFFKFYRLGLAAFLNRLECVRQDGRSVDYAACLRQPVDKLEREKSFAALEKAIADFLTEILKAARYIVFGPEPVLAYYFAKVNEINLVRLILLAKFNDFSPDLVNTFVCS